MHLADGISPDHPALSGHFPGNPIVPGALLLQRIENALQKLYPGERVLGMDRVKFVAPAPIGRDFDIVFKERGTDSVGVEASFEGRVILTGAAVLARSEPA
jgi:3-hydroxyacyl-[acyl-carrier-protein] dehydratase